MNKIGPEGRRRCCCADKVHRGMALFVLSCMFHMVPNLKNSSTFSLIQSATLRAALFAEGMKHNDSRLMA